MPFLFPLLAPLIAEVAPSLVQMATGSETAGRIAASILPEIGRATGLPVSTGGELASAISALRNDPAAFDRVAAEIRAVEAQEFEALLRDRADARARDVEVRRQNGGRNLEASLFMAAIVAMLVGAVAAMIFVPMSEAAAALLGQIAAGLLTIVVAISGFFWGSSAGSKAKDIQLGALASLARPAEPPAPRAGPMQPVQDPGDRPSLRP